MTELDARKAALRRAMRARRAALPIEDAARASEAAAEHAEGLALAIGARVVALFWPLPGEIDATRAIERLAARGVAVALPRMTAPGAPLSFRAFEGEASLIDGPFGCKEPREQARESVPDLVLAPLLGFDPRGGRLGYGGGFYDRTIALMRARSPSVAFHGLAFAIQRLDETPTGPYDARLDGIVTEEGRTAFTR